MPEETLETLDHEVNSESDLARLDQMMAADEAAYDRGRQAPGSDTSTGRDDKGRFTSANQASIRAGQSSDTKKDSSGTEGASGKPSAGSASAADASASTNQSSDGKTDAGGKDDGGTPGKDKTGAAEPSNYAKARERQERSWQKLNEEKLKLEADRARHTAEVAEFERRRGGAVSGQQAGQQNSGGSPGKYTAQDYMAAAQKFEREGKFDLADAAREEAERLRAAGSNGQATGQGAAEGARAPGRGAGNLDQALAASWERAKTEFPEILDGTGPVNTALQKFIQTHPQVLGYKDGPYLAAAFVKASHEASKVGALTQEAAKVPELQKQVDTLTAKVKELEALTSLPSGGGPNLGRGNPAERSWGELSTDEMQTQLDRMFRQAV